MRRSRSWRVATALVTIVIVWYTWPARFGGSMSMVVVNGHSMEPTYHTGDVVIARRSGGYKPGDILVYMVPKDQPGGGHEVVHRLKSIDSQGRFLFQGDNKKSPDDWQVTKNDVVGRPVLLIPQGIRYLSLLLSPFTIGLLGAGAVVALLWPRKVAVKELATAGPVRQNAHAAVARFGTRSVPRFAEASRAASVEIHRWGARVTGALLDGSDTVQTTLFYGFPDTDGSFVIVGEDDAARHGNVVSAQWGFDVVSLVSGNTAGYGYLCFGADEQAKTIIADVPFRYRGAEGEEIDVIMQLVLDNTTGRTTERALYLQKAPGEFEEIEPTEGDTMRAQFLKVTPDGACQWISDDEVVFDARRPPDLSLKRLPAGTETYLRLVAVDQDGLADHLNAWVAIPADEAPRHLDLTEPAAASL
jgi:signal peptidase